MVRFTDEVLEEEERRESRQRQAQVSTVRFAEVAGAEHTSGTESGAEEIHPRILIRDSEVPSNSDAEAEGPRDPRTSRVKSKRKQSAAPNKLAAQTWLRIDSAGGGTWVCLHPCMRGVPALGFQKLCPNLGGRGKRSCPC